MVDASKRSDHSNAFLFGFWKNKRIVIFDTLKQHCTSRQIVAVLTHEIAHWKYNHTLKLMLLNYVNLFFLFFVFSFVINREDIFISFGFD